MKTNPTAVWLLGPGARSLALEPFMGTLVARARAEGLPLHRVSCSVRTRNPEVWVVNLRWSADEGTTISLRPHGFHADPRYVAGPVAHIYQGGDGFRQSLVASPLAYDFPLLRELAQEGFTDYLIEPLELTEDVRSFVSWATQSPGGFSDGQLVALRELTVPLSAALALLSERQALESLLAAYLGKKPAQRVLGGEYRRAQVTTLNAVIWFCDLRGFTRFVDQSPSQAVLDRLNRYFDLVGTAIQCHHGEILKFIGDAILAVFPFDHEGQAKQAALHALGAAEEALGALAENERDPPLEVGIGLHVGSVNFGNVGTLGRLDFTVIGGAVNEASRVEALCKEQQTRLLLTEDLARLLEDERLVSIGVHPLRGVTAQRELFTLPAYCAAENAPVDGLPEHQAGK